MLFVVHYRELEEVWNLIDLFQLELARISTPMSL